MKSGFGVEKHLEEAARYFKLAADQGYVEAQVEYAECLENGRGVEQNLELAAYYRQRADNQRHKSWIKQRRLKVALFVAVLALVIPAALIFAGVIALTSEIAFGLIIAAFIVAVFAVVLMIKNYRNSKEPEKQTAIVDHDQPGLVRID